MASDTQPTLGNPAALGLIGFGLTTVMLSLVNAGALPASGMGVVIPLALVFGGTAQFIAGILEWRAGNTFGMAAFMSYGAFWVWFALLLLFAQHGVIDAKGIGVTINATLLAWGVFTMYMWIPTFRLNGALWAVFFTLWITYYLLGLGGLFHISGLSIAGGWVGLACGLIACYTAFAIVTNETAGRSVLPIMPFGKKPAPESV